jgi:hypothetical protein
MLCAETWVETIRRQARGVMTDNAVSSPCAKCPVRVVEKTKFGIVLITIIGKYLLRLLSIPANTADLDQLHTLFDGIRAQNCII